MKVLSGGPGARADRPASELVHDEANARVVAFHLQPGQRVAAHRSESTVLVHVIAGSGRFHGEDAETVLTAGQCAVFARGEMHAIDAGAEPLRFFAIITPRPEG